MAAPASRCLSSQPSERSTAARQLARPRSRSSSSICGSQRLSSAQRSLSSARSFQKPTRQPGGVGRAQRRGLGDRRAGSPARPGRRPGTASAARWRSCRRPRAARGRARRPRRWRRRPPPCVCHAVASSAARAMWPWFAYAVSPQITPRASSRQCGANRPENGGHEVHAAVVVHRLGQLLDRGGVGDDLEPVAQPLDQRAGHRDRALERVAGGLVAELVRRAWSAASRCGRSPRRCSPAGRSRCRRCSWPRPARSRSGRTARPAGRRGCRTPGRPPRAVPLASP